MLSTTTQIPTLIFHGENKVFQVRLLLAFFLKKQPTVYTTSSLRILVGLEMFNSLFSSAALGPNPVLFVALSVKHRCWKTGVQLMAF